MALANDRPPGGRLSLWDEGYQTTIIGASTDALRVGMGAQVGAGLTEVASTVPPVDHVNSAVTEIR
jgi:hypothetical protein